MMRTMDRQIIIEELHDVVKLDYDAIKAYQAAMARLDRDSYREKLSEFQRDHERHVRELSEAIETRGGKPPTGGDIRQVLTKGRVILANIGGDENILKAMKANENETKSKYAEVATMNFPDDIKSLLRTGLADERRHRSWLEETLTKMMT